MALKRREFYSLPDQQQLRRLHREGFLPESVFRTFLVETKPSAKEWLRCLRVLLLLLGWTLVAAGVLLLLAGNWSSLGSAARFTFLEAMLAAAVLAAFLYDGRRREGRILLLAASVLTGVLLAVCCHTYHLPCAAWEFLGGWSLLIFGWVVAGRSVSLWGLWLALVHLSVFFLWGQLLASGEVLSIASAALPLASLNTSLLFLWERGRGAGVLWLRQRWPRLVLLPLILVLLGCPVLEMLFTPAPTFWQSLSLPLWLLAALWSYRHYRRHFPDSAARGLIIFSGGLLLIALTGRLLLAGGGEDLSSALFGLAMLSLAAGGFGWLHRAGETRSAGEESRT